MRCPSNRLLQGAERSQYVDMGKFCNAAADDSKGNPNKGLFMYLMGRAQDCSGRCCSSLVYAKYTAVVAPSPEQSWARRMAVWG